jgi:hypothetical protein
MDSKNEILCAFPHASCMCLVLSQLDISRGGRGGGDILNRNFNPQEHFLYPGNALLLYVESGS